MINKRFVTGGDDYNSGPYIVHFPARMTKVSFNVTITKDNISEQDEIFYLTINSSALPEEVSVGATGDTSIVIVGELVISS